VKETAFTAIYYSVQDSKKRRDEDEKEKHEGSRQDDF
jgi:hypothetical protein